VWRSNSAMLSACNGGTAGRPASRAPIRKKTREQEIVFNRREHLLGLLGRTRRKGSRMDLRWVVIEPTQGAQRRADLVLHPAAHLRRGCLQLLQGKGKAGHYRLLVIGFARVC
jgi:hypothetical protein